MTIVEYGIMSNSSGRPRAGFRAQPLAAWFAGLALCALALALPAARAQAPAANVLTDIQVQPTGGDRVDLRLVTSGPATAPLAFTIENPARIALDLQGTTVGLDSRRKDVKIGAVDSVLTAESGGRTRVVLNLSRMVPYQTRVDGNAVVVSVGTAAPADAVTFPAATTAAAAPAARGGRRIDNIDFRRGEKGSGRIIVTLSDPGTPVDVRKEAGQLVLAFGGAELPDALRKRLDVTDFATPVNSIEASRAGGGARIAINARLPYEELAYQSDGVFTVEVSPVVEKPAEAAKPTLFDAKRDYNGERLTLSFQDIETRAVLQLLADVSGRNIVVSDTVEGNVTLRLQNVPWDQALDIVLATKGLDMRENGNVIIVAPAAEIAAREKADLEARQEIVKLEPLVSEFVQVNYAKAVDLAQLIRGNQQGLIGGAGGGGAGGGNRNSLLSQRGSVGIDERTNTLLVQDVPERIAAIRRLVAQLDIPVRQVLIESRIVVVNDDFSRSLGVRWGATAVRERGDDGLIAVTGNGNGTNGIVNSAIGNINSSGSPFPVTLPAPGDRYNVNLPVANPAGQFALAILDDDYLVDLELSALQAEGRGEVISSPRVITANQKEASIRQGVEIPFQQAASSGATVTQFKEAVLSLTVTPQVTPDDRIILDLRVTKDSVGEVITNERGGQVPSIDTRAVETQVLVDNGQTVVLGGIYETEQFENVRKVPFLGDIPGLGALFRQTTRQSNKSELLIFVTPKILKEGSNIY